jgi:hypothetical protein
MKSSYLGAAALACALGLSACGGSGSGQLVLGGQAYGVTKPGLILQNNGAHDLAVNGSGNFAFQDLMPIDAEYNVTLKSATSIPPNAEKCEIFNGKGRSAFDVLNIQVVCTLKTHALAGSITGLGNATGLVVVNGSDKKEIPPGAMSFAMDKVGEDVPYGITILTQPVNKMCSITRGVGTMGTADVTDVQINCVPAT